MMSPIVYLLIAQVIYSTKDLLARFMVRNDGFNTQTLHKPLFYLIVLMHVSGLMLQMYVFSHFGLGKTMTILTSLSLALSVTLGWLVLGEQISLAMYLAIALAMSAFLVTAFAVK